MQPRSWLTLLKIACVTVAAIVFADLTSVYLRGRVTSAPSTQPIAPAAPASAAPALTEQQSVDGSRALLGSHADITKEKPQAGASGAPANATPVVPAAQVPDPSTQMTLIGTMVAPGASMAIVMVTGNEHVAREGDSLGSPAFRVAEIRETSVVLEASGVKKTLWMPSFQPPAGGEAAAPPSGVLPPPPVPVPVAAPSPEAAAPGKSVISKAERDKVMGNLQDTLKDLRILPNKKSGADYGSKVVFLQAGSFLSKVGLAQDDILLSVNGTPVNNAEQGLNVFQAFQHEDRIVMKLDRGGKLIQQEVEFR